MRLVGCILIIRVAYMVAVFLWRRRRGDCSSMADRRFFDIGTSGRTRKAATFHGWVESYEEEALECRSGQSGAVQMGPLPDQRKKAVSLSERGRAR
jgi:hypothetical protein